jgi:hypothetical protein
MSDTIANQNSSTESKPVVTLSDFIGQNQNLITVLGVFTALTVFAGSIPLPPFRDNLSFFFMSLTILVWIELWRNIPKGNYTWRLRWFQNILSFSILSLVAYWFIGYSQMWQGYIVVAISSIIAVMLKLINKKLHLYEKWYESQSIRFRKLRKITWVVFVILLIVGQTYFAIKVSPSIGKTLNDIHQKMASTKP